MPRAGTYQTEAIVIKKTKLGEADRILTFYTPEFGKVQAVAKGVRRPKSKLSGHLELLTHSMVLLVKGRSLDTITGSQTIDSFLPLKSNLELCASALYGTELVYQFGVDRQENGVLFTLLLDLMRELSKDEDCQAADVLLRYFDIHLLHAVGYDPQLQECLVCREPMTSGPAYFSVAAGGTVCLRCRHTQPYTYSISMGTLEALRCLQNGDWSSAHQVTPDQKTRREIELLLRNYTRYILERDIRTAGWLDALRQTNKRLAAPSAAPSPVPESPVLPGTLPLLRSNASPTD